MIRTASLIALSFLASGCTTDLNRKSKEYGIMSEVVQTEYGKFKIYEHPTGKRIAASRTAGDAFGQGVVMGATLGLAKGRPSQGAYQEAVEIYFTKHKALESCKVLNGYILSEPVFEFVIECP